VPRGLARAVSPVAVVAIWQLLSSTGVLPPRLLAAPSTVLSTAWDLTRSGQLGEALLVSLQRVVVGLVLGVLAGLCLGLASGLSRWGELLLDPVLQALRTLPFLGLIPLFILWFGIGELSKILLIFLSVFLIMMVNAQAGSRSCALDALRAAQSMGAGRWQTFRFVVLPSALPQIMTGLRVSMGTGLTILVASELLGGDRGLGFVILDASSFFRTTYVFAGIILIGLIGLVSDRGIAYLARRIVHWEGKS